MNLIKPKKLQKGDTVATVSLSWGGAGEVPHRYQAGKKQLEDVFGLKVIEMTNTLKPAQWLQDNPKARADDLHEALLNPEVKAIISNIGGSDSIRLLPYIDFDIIRDNPKIFLGFSDSTITHFMFYKTGITSFYGTSLLVGFAENGGMLDYVKDNIQRSLFSSAPIGEIKASSHWTSERLEWRDASLAKTKRMMTENRGWRWINGNGTVTGRLLGGCADVIERIKATPLWVDEKNWQDSILFLETSERFVTPEDFTAWLRNYAASGVLSRINAIIMGRPQENRYWQEYDNALFNVVVKEQGLTHMPIITGMDFGHSSPTFTLPFGVLAEIDCDQQTFSLLESGLACQ